MKVEQLLRSDKKIELHNVYHVAPSEYDQTIKEQGLYARDPNGIYVWNNPHYAQWFAELHREDGEDMTVWQVNVSGLPVKVDEETIDMSEWSSRFDSGEFGEGYIIERNHIPPERLITITHL